MLLIAGGIIPWFDREELKRQGVAEIFSPGTPFDRIVDYIRSNVAQRRENLAL